MKWVVDYYLKAYLELDLLQRIPIMKIINLFKVLFHIKTKQYEDSFTVEQGNMFKNIYKDNIYKEKVWPVFNIV